MAYKFNNCTWKGCNEDGDTEIPTAIIEINSNTPVKIWIGTQQEYASITPSNDTIYMIY